MTTRTRILFAVPALGFALTALVLATGAIAGGESLPPHQTPQGSVSAKPSDLSPNATTRDWQEVGGSGSKRKPK